MHIVVAIDVHHDHNLSTQESEGHQPLLAVIFPSVFTRDGEVVPDGLCALEVQAVNFDVAPTLWLVPGRDGQIVSTI